MALGVSPAYSSEVDHGSRGKGLVKPVRSLPFNFIHIDAVDAIRELLMERDIEPRSIFEQAGIDVQIFEDLEAVSFASLGRLTALAASQTRCAHFGLLVGQRATLRSLGLLACLMRHSETVGAALQALATYHHLLNRGALIEVATVAEVGILRYSPYDPATEGVALHCERALATLTNVLRSLCGPGWSPDEVLLPRRAPPDAAPYASFFHCPVRFEQETATLVFPAQLMRRPIAGAHPLVRNAAGRRIQQLETFIPSAVTSEVQRYVRSAAAQKRIGRHPVAQTLAIDKRTLTRRLRAEATSFKVVVNQTRFSMAKQLLADTNLSLTDIAAALDFSEAAAFTHAFRRWAGTTPSAWRRDQRRD